MPLQLDLVMAQIRKAAEISHRDPSDIRLLPVSKTHQQAVIRDAYKMGLRNFAENYADELAQKSKELIDLKNISWTFIGQLQSNKIKKIVEHASEIQSLASEKHANYINRYAKEFNKCHFPIWICVNIENESTKGGVSPQEALSLANYITNHCPYLELQGIMAIPPAKYSDAKYNINNLPKTYTELRALANTVGKGLLSLGMSSDLNIAIGAGTNCIRIGTALFGARTT